MPALTNLSFADWIEHAFSHEIRPHGNAWFFDPDPDWWDPDPAQAVAYVTRLFTEAPAALEWFSDDQIAQGLTYLMNTMASGDNGWFYSRTVPEQARRECIAAMQALFRDIFAPRCKPLLSNLSEAGASSLNGVAYMWFDVLPSFALPDDPAFERLNLDLVRTMEAILALDSAACQESALHGVGHWHRLQPQAVEQAIDRYLARGTAARPELSAYAAAARCGCVQ